MTVCGTGLATATHAQKLFRQFGLLAQAKLPNDYTQKDAVLEVVDNSLEASYHKDLELHKPKAIFLTYGKTLDTEMPALDFFDGGIGMAGMDSSTGGIAAWATLVSRLEQHVYSPLCVHRVPLCWLSLLQVSIHAQQYGAAVYSSCVPSPVTSLLVCCHLCQQHLTG